MVSRIVAAVDAGYAEVNRIRIRRAMHQLALEGRPNGGRVFGYLPTVGADGRKTRVVIPEEAEAIRWAASELLRGATFASVARAFEAQGLRHVKQGKRWDSPHIKNMVTNPAVAGLRPDPDGRFIPAVWEPILDEPSWLRLRAMLSGSRMVTRRDGTRYSITTPHQRARRHLLTAGLTICGVCGAPLAAQSKRRPNGERFVSYLCNPRRGGACVGIVAHRLEPFVLDALFARLEDDNVAALLRGPNDAYTAKLARALDEAEVELVYLARARGRGEISRMEWLAAREGFARRADGLRDTLSRLTIADVGPPRDLQMRWPSMTLAAQRAVLAAVFERIEVHRLRSQRRRRPRIRLYWRTPAESGWSESRTSP